MILIGENIHIISKSVREALVKRDEKFLIELINIQKNMDYVDLNIGPAKGELQGVMPWLTSLVEENCGLGISFDTTNVEEMKTGLAVCKKSENAFINSTSKDEERLEVLTDLAVEYGCNLIALTLSRETGIPKTSDSRLEIAFEIYEKCIEKGINTEKLYFDPLILPLCVEQSQALEALHTIQMVKESFEPPVKTVIGLSNISNGCPVDLRPLINRVYGVLAYGAGLDAAIIDAKDCELVRIFRMLEASRPEKPEDELYIRLANMIEEFSDIEDIEFNTNSYEEQRIIKCAQIILNKKIYSHSLKQI